MLTTNMRWFLLLLCRPKLFKKIYWTCRKQAVAFLRAIAAYWVLSAFTVLRNDTLYLQLLVDSQSADEQNLIARKRQKTASVIAVAVSESTGLLLLRAVAAHRHCRQRWLYPVAYINLLMLWIFKRLCMLSLTASVAAPRASCTDMSPFRSTRSTAFLVLINSMMPD